MWLAKDFVFLNLRVQCLSRLSRKKRPLNRCLSVCNAVNIVISPVFGFWIAKLRTFLTAGIIVSSSGCVLSLTTACISVSQSVITYLYRVVSEEWIGGTSCWWLHELLLAGYVKRSVFIQPINVLTSSACLQSSVICVCLVSNESLSARSRPSSRRSARRPKKTELKRTASSLDVSVSVLHVDSHMHTLSGITQLLDVLTRS